LNVKQTVVKLFLFKAGGGTKDRDLPRLEILINKALH